MTNMKINSCKINILQYCLLDNYHLIKTIGYQEVHTKYTKNVK